jgi:hypothetical protein
LSKVLKNEGHLFIFMRELLQRLVTGVRRRQPATRASMRESVDCFLASLETPIDESADAGTIRSNTIRSEARC